RLTAIHHWAETYDYLQIDTLAIQMAAREMETLYEPTTYDQIRGPFLEQNQTYQMTQNEKIATKNSVVKQLEEEIEVEKIRLHEWETKQDPEPPNMMVETIAAREKLQTAEVPFIPLYEAIEFHGHVEEQVRIHLEAALMDSGLLNALITE